MKLRLPKVYPITNAGRAGISILEQVRILTEAGARLIQLRAKDLDDRRLFETAAAAAELTRTAGCRLIVNDRVDIARLAGADGVHLGQGDLSPAAARDLLGPDAMIGFSTHSLEQVHKASVLPVDYIAFGPIFETTTKSDTDPVVGLSLLAEAKQLVGERPLVAIGGIDPASVDGVLSAGADSAAMISGIWTETREIEPKIREYFF
ncbi:MAG: thiamine phosphate synthase [Pyrinomonadaceae bacterium]